MSFEGNRTTILVLWDAVETEFLEDSDNTVEVDHKSQRSFYNGKEYEEMVKKVTCKGRNGMKWLPQILY